MNTETYMAVGLIAYILAISTGIFIWNKYLEDKDGTK